MFTKFGKFAIRNLQFRIGHFYLEIRAVLVDKNCWPNSVFSILSYGIIFQFSVMFAKIEFFLVSHYIANVRLTQLAFFHLWAFKVATWCIKLATANLFCNGARPFQVSALWLFFNVRDLAKLNFFSYNVCLEKIIVIRSDEGHDLGLIIYLLKPPPPPLLLLPSSSTYVVPDAMAYTTLISALCKGNRVNKAYELFKGLKNKGELIDRAIYGALVEGFVADGKQQQQFSNNK
ncbi:hypothetical protein BVRB_5g107760 [Beta vulgaris subsp. vulgaris]|nr:hypothetical protein BVRB_5g107760 [Beta vulgaris subsp. vulgaris]